MCSSLNIVLWWLWVTVLFVTRPSIGAVQRASELNCHFDAFCLWRNATDADEDIFDWQTAQAVNLHQTHLLRHSSSCTDQKRVFSSSCGGIDDIIFMQSNHPDDKFQYAVGHGFGTDAWLVSPVIAGQVGDGLLRFSTWRSSYDVSLRVCGRQPPGPIGVLNCSWHMVRLEPGQNTWTKEEAIIPASNQPFEIIILTFFSDSESLIAIDDIQYTATIKSSSPKLYVEEEVVEEYRPTNFSTPPIVKTTAQFIKTDDNIVNPRPWLANIDRRNQASESDPFYDHGIDSNVQTTGIDHSLQASPGADLNPQALWVGGSLGLPLIADQDSQSLTDKQTAIAAELRQTMKTAMKEMKEAAANLLSGIGPKCDIVDCNFDRDSCSYSSPPRGWVRISSQQAKLHRVTTDPRKPSGSFMFASGAEGKVSVMLSQNFEIEKEAKIRFSYFTMTEQTSRLRLCDWTNLNCTTVWDGSALTSTSRWRTAVAALQPGSHQLAFIADRLQPEYLFAVDNIELLHAGDNTPLECRPS